MKICLLQTKSEKENIKRNIENYTKWIEIAVSEKADLIIFPELTLKCYESELVTDQHDSRLDEF